MKTTLEMLKDFVRKNYGESELENPSYDLESLANYLDYHNGLNVVIRDIVEDLTEKRLDYYPERYEIDRRNEVYNELKAREDVIDNLELEDILATSKFEFAFEEYLKNVI